MLTAYEKGKTQVLFVKGRLFNLTPSNTRLAKLAASMAPLVWPIETHRFRLHDVVQFHYICFVWRPKVNEMLVKLGSLTDSPTLTGWLRI